ncbi:MAG TPA: hypothetical protein VJU16_05490 [Planctomycetota bacterium]|nr:hypothetical protein [Planctomycetota bacterium]
METRRRPGRALQLLVSGVLLVAVALLVRWSIKVEAMHDAPLIWDCPNCGGAHLPYDPYRTMDFMD